MVHSELLAIFLNPFQDGEYDDSGGEEETLSLIMKEEHGVLVVKRFLACLLWASLSLLPAETC